jgi:hypothetical protein
MLPYFYITIPIAIMAVGTPRYRLMPLLWWLAFVVVVLFVGLRHHVGMDWNNYLVMIARANVGSIWDSYSVAEPGYSTLLWIAGQSGWGVYGANLIGTMIFAAGLFRYAGSTPSPWIALLVALPFLVIVVAMSAARQAVAIGLILWLVADWSGASVRKRVVLIVLAASFHMSAIGFLAFVFLDLKVPIWVKVSGSAFMALLIIYALQSSGHASYYDDLYGRGQTELTQSTGAIFHVILNGGPALLCFCFGRQVREILIKDRLHKQLAIIAIALIPLSFVMSAASGRIALYLFPVSMWFFATMPLLIRDTGSRFMIKAIFGLFFISVLATWLIAGNAASAHGNYRNALFISPDKLSLCCN